MVRVLCPVILLIGTVFCVAGPAQAEITVREAVIYYDVEATTLSGIRSQMQKRGPRGFWAYARWNVQASRDCDVILNVTYTLPRHTKLEALSQSDRDKWLAMTKVLEQHERNHGDHGLSAAKEIKAANCKGRWKIIRKWAKQDKVYDKETDHGRKEGVVLQ